MLLKYYSAVASTIKWILAAILLIPVTAHAELMLYPTRVVIEDRQRGGHVEMINRSQETQTFRIGLYNSRMTEAGEIVVAETPEPGELFAKDMLVFTPRQVTLRPGQSQTVRISIRRPANLATGEYRTHLRFSRMTDADGPTNLETAVKLPPGQVGILLQAMIGASIPVIVRQGTTQAEVTLDSPALISAKGGNPPIFYARFHRKGTRSVYGDLKAFYTPPGRRPIEVGKMGGVSVYVPNATRTIRMPLTLPPGTALKGGTLSLRYTERQEAGGALLTQTQVQVP